MHSVYSEPLHKVPAVIDCKLSTPKSNETASVGY